MPAWFRPTSRKEREKWGTHGCGCAGGKAGSSSFASLACRNDKAWSNVLSISCLTGFK